MQDDDVSPESRIVPTKDMDQTQLEATGEKLPELTLELCDKCQWCMICFNHRGIIEKCPMCGFDASLVPMKLNEVCSIVKCGGGIEIRFDRQKPMR